MLAYAFERRLSLLARRLVFATRPGHPIRIERLLFRAHHIATFTAYCALST